MSAFTTNPLSADPLAALAACQTQLPGSALPWLRRRRDAASARFAETGFPTTRDEDWKYTSVAAIARRAFAPAAAVPPARVQRAVSAFDFVGGSLLVFVNGHHVPALSRLHELPAGTVIDSLAARLARESAELETLLYGPQDGDDASVSNGFTLLNDAYWSDGAFIAIAPAVVIDAPIHLLFVTMADEAGQGTTAATFVRNLIRVGRGARANVIEHYVGVQGPAYLTDAHTRVVAEEGAVLNHCKLQEEAARAFHIATLQFAQSRASRVVSQSFALGAQLSRNDIATRLDGEDCEATLLGLYVGDRRRHIDHHTRIDHLQPRCTSREHYKGVLDDAARAVFNGRVLVHRDAQHSDAEQANHNLLLSDDAEVDTKPQLEIYADDVKCSHGATVGQIDAEQRYYLRTRGIDDATARAMLIRAFADEIVAQAEPAPLRTRLEAWLGTHLATHDKERTCKELETS
ncbi:MAG TPA: Fe-S cluster assembly protein SufD [Rhodocyclaceae bacterium]|nr:Fe-S cluster assembly protein SufD [Rhodocyclaceae bacterium]